MGEKMIQRYWQHEEPSFTAWLEGLNDAVEFLDHQLYKADEVASWKDLQSIITELSITIAFAYEEKLERDDNLRRGPISLPTNSSTADSWPEESFTSGSTWARENFGSLEQLRASGSIQPERLARDAYPDTRCECSHRMDRHDREVSITEVPESQGGGFILRVSAKKTEDTKFGTRRRSHPSYYRRSES
jgi:hypothetical protein